MGFVQTRKNLFSRHARHPHVEQNKVRRVGQALGKTLHRVYKDLHGGARQAQHPLDVLPQRGFVVDHNNAAHSVVPPANQW
jgi:hypothetical protein